jgi:2-amino-4-hydroxy-6-hydroxymethyldihydropteridine diphosphokinase
LLEAALGALSAAGLKIADLSRWWRSSAWPDPADPPYLNGVVIVETDLAPEQVLMTLHRIEQVFGRDRAGSGQGEVRNAPRTLDLDLIAYGRVVTDRPALPHPRAHERRFVMGPLAEIAPDWVHPVLRDTAAELVSEAPVGLDAEPI